jgi:large subunit ribosomal protein L17
MNHGKKIPKLGRTAEHRKALISNLTVSLIEHRRIRTTVAKAKAVRPFAEKILTLAKKASAANEGRSDTKTDTPKALHYRRLALARLRNNGKAVRTLIDVIAPAHKDRQGGYTRITKLGQRRSDASPMAFLEWMDTPKPQIQVESAPAAEAEVVETKVEEAAAPEAKPKKPRAASKKAAKKKAKEDDAE